MKEEVLRVYKVAVGLADLCDKQEAIEREWNKYAATNVRQNCSPLTAEEKDLMARLDDVKIRRALTTGVLRQYVAEAKKVL